MRFYGNGLLTKVPVPQISELANGPACSLILLLASNISPMAPLRRAARAAISFDRVNGCPRSAFKTVAPEAIAPHGTEENFELVEKIPPEAFS